MGTAMDTDRVSIQNIPLLRKWNTIRTRTRKFEVFPWPLHIPLRTPHLSPTALLHIPLTIPHLIRIYNLPNTICMITLHMLLPLRLCDRRVHAIPTFTLCNKNLTRNHEPTRNQKL